MKSTRQVTITVLILGILFSGCASFKALFDKDPDWLRNPGALDPRTGDLKHFVGVSTRYSTEADARLDAIGHGGSQILTFLGVFAESFLVDVRITDGMGSDILDIARKKDMINRSFSDAFVAGVAAQKFHIEEGKDKDQYGTVRSYYKVYVLLPFSKSESSAALGAALRDIQNKELLERAKQLSDNAWQGFQGRLQGDQQ